ncbi:hypothetical protein KIH74_35375 [Kineosporia sp. J2-2]|uniref:Uncharacterized protein n=1 Tax=Kineosporia corallincola TaxID=2835133 RepID=A0ABS5TU54_9ACTN|nr:hypothetical protein [Kineosporia corallincola]MBT0774279.1 hypothetical protein [Kineosporia corallincola]
MLYRPPLRIHSRPVDGEHMPRRRLWAFMIGVAGIAGTALLGAALAAAQLLLGEDSRPRSAEPVPRHSEAASAQAVSARRNAMAWAPYRQYADVGSSPRSSARSNRPEGASMLLPASTVIGRLDVATGYPMTAEGAVAQLAAIDVAAWRAGQVGPATAIVRTWTDSSMLTSSGRQMIDLMDRWPKTGARPLMDVDALSIVPRMALIKGSDGPHWHVVCIVVDLSGGHRPMAPLSSFTHCERMIWVQSRWMIEGKEPLRRLENVSIDSSRAYALGFQQLQSAPAPFAIH